MPYCGLPRSPLRPAGSAAWAQTDIAAVGPAMLSRNGYRHSDDRQMRDALHPLQRSGCDRLGARVRQKALGPARSKAIQSRYWSTSGPFQLFEPTLKARPSTLGCCCSSHFSALSQARRVQCTRDCWPAPMPIPAIQASRPSWTGVFKAMVARSESQHLGGQGLAALPHSGTGPRVPAVFALLAQTKNEQLAVLDPFCLIGRINRKIRYEEPFLAFRIASASGSSRGR